MGLGKLKSIIASSNTETFKQGCSGKGATILVGNSFSVLQGFTDEALDLVKETLTYENQEAVFELQQLKIQLGMAYRYRIAKRINWLKARQAELEQNLMICWLKGNKFPTGHLILVLEALDKAGVEFTFEDSRKNLAKTVDFKWKNAQPEPRYFQNEMVDLGEKYHRGVFESAVGTGKTYICQLLVHRLKVPTLIVLPSKDLSVQTYDSFCNAFGDKQVELINSPAKAKTKKPIRICTIHTLVGLEKKGGLETVLDGIGMICIDEVHHAGARSYTDLLPYFEHIYYRFGFSGTFMRNDSRTLDMWGFLSTVLYKYSAGQATKEGFLTPLKVIVHKIEGIRTNSYQSEYTKNYCKNDELLQRIQRIIVEDVGPQDQVLILVGRKEKSGNVIHEFLNGLGISNEYVSGDSKRDVVREALKNFNEKKTKVLIGSSIIGEGIDVRSTDHLIMAQGGKSEIAITQAVGRAVRLFPGKKVAYVHDFRFETTKYLEKHLNRRLDIYKKNFEGEVI